ncbi:MAG: hypothetical protein LKM31_16735 [Sphingobium sp.]|jgi:hypothetical protein|nr:hypothetical protein [Sphingobium sp.]
MHYVRDLRHAENGDAAHLVGILWRLDKGQVRSRLDEGLGTLQRRVDPLHGQSICARDDECISRARIGGGADLGQHFRQRDHALAIEMAAPFGEILILELDCGRARPLQHLHRPPGVYGIAEAGVGIDNERQRDRVCDP